MRWESIVLGYVTYLAVVAAIAPRFRRARGPVFAAAFAAWTIWAMARDTTQPLTIQILLPAGCLLGGYWLSGLFFVGPMARLERWRLRIDERSGMSRIEWPRVVRDYFELAYALVYAVVPAGALTLAFGGHAAAVPRFWSVVLLAEFLSYGMLPWVQTRPPRAIESAKDRSSSAPPLRQFNLAVLGRASIQANTLPSGHAAGAVAAALAVATVMPTAALAFFALAVSIAIATVIGRYHYIVDSALGVVVAVGAWLALR